MNNQMEKIKIVGSVFFDDELSSIGVSVKNKRAVTFVRESRLLELEAKNEKLRACVEFSYDNNHLDKEEFIISVQKMARKTLKEIKGE